MSVFGFPTLIDERDGRILSLSPDVKSDGLKMSDICTYRSGDTFVTGRPIVSDPSTLLGMILNENLGGQIYKPILGMLCSKSRNRAVGVTNLYIETIDLAYYPRIANVYDLSLANEHIAESRFKLVDGRYPSGIVEYTFKRQYVEGQNTEVQYVRAECFTWQDVFYLVCDVQNVDMLNMGMIFKSRDWINPDVTDYTAGIETDATTGQQMIVVEDHSTGYFVALTCTQMNEYQIDTVPVTVIYGLDEAKNSVSHSACCIGLGRSGMSRTGKDKVVFCISMGIVKEDAKQRVVAGVTGYTEALLAAEAWWSNFFAGISTQWFAPDELKVKGYMALNQIASCMYGDFITAGLPNWGDNYLRDTGHLIARLAPLMPTVAKNLLSWFKDCTTLTRNNHFDAWHIAGEPGDYANTDNGATFLLAAGMVWKYTKDIDCMTALKPRMDEVLQYALDNYSGIDNHILCQHPHDDLDDYQEAGMINTADVKYESMIDVLWLAALQLVGPVYYQLGDTSRRQSCAVISAGLMAGIEDYRRSDGGLEYAIKQDGTLYSTVLNTRSNIYAAEHLNDSQCMNWLRRPEIVNVLGLLGSNLHWAVIPYWFNDTTHVQSYKMWSEHLPLVAMIAAKLGDYYPLRLMLDTFPLGGWPDYSTIDDVSSFNVRYWSHAYSHIWPASAIIKAIHELYKVDRG